MLPHNISRGEPIPCVHHRITDLFHTNPRHALYSAGDGSEAVYQTSSLNNITLFSSVHVHKVTRMLRLALPCRSFPSAKPTCVPSGNRCTRQVERMCRAPVEEFKSPCLPGFWSISQLLRIMTVSDDLRCLLEDHTPEWTHHHWSWGNLAPLLLVLFPLWWVTVIVYRIWFHPLSHIPGPRLAAATHLYHAYYQVHQGGMFFKKRPELMDKYGKFCSEAGGGMLTW